MRISELVQQLERLKDQHGDIGVYAHDGMDPSDFMPVSSVGFYNGVPQAPVGESVKEGVFIRA